MAQYYPDPKRGLHFGLGFGFGFASLGRNSHQRGRRSQLLGFSRGGPRLLLFRQWSLGATLRMTVARTYTHAEGDLDIASTTLLPALLATVTLH
jgi:hypothetical protein